MKKLTVILISLLILTLILGVIGCGGEDEFRAIYPGLYITDDRDEAWRLDLKYMIDNLRTSHSNLFYEISEEDFDRAVSSLHDSIPSLTDDEIIIELSRILAMIGDAHTRLFFINSLLSPIDPSQYLSKYFQYPKLAFRTYPIRAYWLTDGLLVVGSTQEYSNTLGTKIIQIGNKSPEEIKELVSPLISHSTEEAITLVSPTHIISPEILHTLGIIEDMGNVLFTFQDSKGNVFQSNLSPYDPSPLSEEDIQSQKFSVTDISPLSYNQNPLWETALSDIEEESYPLYLKNPFSNYWYEYLEDNKTVYFQFNMVKDIPEGQSFSSFFDEMLDFIDQNDVEKLVMDFRFNRGGDYTIAESKWKDLGEHTINKNGQIFTIIGRATGSACIVSSEFVKEHTVSLFVGESVYDTLEMYYNNPAVDLPNSELSFVVAYGPRIFPDNNEQIVPDIKIKMSSEDYLSGRDVVLEHILDY